MTSKPGYMFNRRAALPVQTYFISLLRMDLMLRK